MTVVDKAFDRRVSTHPTHGIGLLRESRGNKSTGFSDEERVERGLLGLLPPAAETLDRQIQRCLMQLQKKPTDIERYIYLTQLLDTDETLLYKPEYRELV